MSMEAQVFETYAPPGLSETYAAWEGGKHLEFGFSVAWAKGQCSEPVAEALYSLSVMCEHAAGLNEKFRAVKDWGYTVAASYASSGRQKYRLDWGRQAARDGLFLALWDRSELRLPSTVARAEHFGVGEKKYRRVRGHVRDQANALIGEFTEFLYEAVKSPD